MYKPVAANPHWNVGISPRVRPGGGPVVLSGAMVRDLVDRSTRRRQVPVLAGHGVLQTRRGLLGLGDKLTDAENLLRAAGYSGAQCRTEEVGYPGGSYRQDVCSAPGFVGGMMVDAILQNRAAGGGVDLAAQRAFDIRYGGQHDNSVSYFSTVGKDSVPIIYGGSGPTSTVYEQKTTNTPGGSTAARPVNVTLENVSNPGGALRVGDNWLLRISASSNSEVTGAATQDGKDLGASSFGRTDANGALAIKGTFEAGNIGVWVQKWTVNGSTGTLTFTVQPKLQIAGGSNTDSTYKGGSGSAPGSGSGSSSGAADSEWSWDTKIFGLPLWAVGGGALAAAFVFGGKR